MLQTPTIKFRSTGEAADVLHTQTWRVARVIELGLVDDPDRIGGRRVIPDTLLPQIKAALIAKGWLPKETEASNE